MYLHQFLTSNSIPMSTSWSPNVWDWISSLPPPSQWKSNSTSISICKSTSTHSSLNLTITKSLPPSNPKVFLSIVAQLHIPISLWTSSSFHLNTNQETLMFLLFRDVVNGVLKYSPNRKSSFFNSPSMKYDDDIKELFDLAFLSLALILCIYEAPPGDLYRTECLKILEIKLTSPIAKRALLPLVRLLGSNLEENWMGSINLAITNRLFELKLGSEPFKAPCPLFSYALGGSGLWKAQLYCPIIAMPSENSSGAIHDERLKFSLMYQQLQGVIQLAYKVVIKDNWIDVVVGVDNVRCDVTSLLSKSLMSERGLGPEEKHFPSRVTLHLTPSHQRHITSVSVHKSTNNPITELSTESTIEVGFDPPNSYLGLKVSTSETATTTIKPWKFEQSVYGYTASLNWFLHDGINGREVFSSKPSKLELLQPKTWFRDRYSSAYRPFTKRGGVVFARDEYGEVVRWKIDGGMVGRSMEWEIRGVVWVTYWPNKVKSFYNESRRLEFKEVVHVPLVKH